MKTIYGHRRRKLPFLINVLALMRYDFDFMSEAVDENLNDIFYWKGTPEGQTFWLQICDGLYDCFYERYPLAEQIYAQGGVDVLRIYYKLTN